MKTVQTILAVFFFVQIVQAQQQVISLYRGVAPGSEDWNWDEKVMQLGNTGSGLVYNVSKPTLTVFEPDSVTANGTAVVICPGGAFQFLSIESEGNEVARWLNKKGYTAFVLRYRLSHSLTDNPMQELMEKQPNSEKFNKDIEPVVAMAISDGKAAISYLRRHADEYGILKDRIGIIGFSAGGTVVTGVAYTYDPESRPDFVAPIYPYVGSFDHSSVPADAPPLFILAASDDIFGFNEHCVNLYNDWINVKKSAELHIYAKGDHGFGMNKKNLPVDTWIKRFADWLNMLGFE